MYDRGGGETAVPRELEDPHGLLQVRQDTSIFVIKKNQTEEKVKVVAAVWGTYLNAALAI